MEKVIDLVKAVNVSGPDYDADGHRQIYDHFSTIITDKSIMSDKHAPPALFFYAIRNILYPTFKLGQIPDALNILAEVDLIRQHVVNKASDALEWNKFYQGQGTKARLLHEKEETRLADIVSENEQDRKIYVLLIYNLCRLHIHYLWSAPESCLLPKRMNDYFPGCLADASTASQVYFQSGLSDPEKEIFNRLKAECIQWMKLVTIWEERREIDLADQGISAEEMDKTFKDDLEIKFPPPIEQDRLATAIGKYVRKVERMVLTMEICFPLRS
ncbi:hypothetical protein BV22DRAFT_1060586 [Leucogyrophana mollusca]|uniref:Uncharacterized protein n=1 Tax=Leucogyrophana mollusca TaxID=85980 RepID=A0ACB8BP09_9AGAM|nr:hypothetical protein BV22DRAFT_1060586 [Leucogyrophana mollusca]